MSEDRMLNERVIPRMRASMELDGSAITTLPTKVLSGLLDYVEELERMASAADAASGVLMLSAPGEAESLRLRIAKAIKEAQKVARLYGA
jgi:hypothetical protein